MIQTLKISLKYASKLHKINTLFDKLNRFDLLCNTLLLLHKCRYKKHKQTIAILNKQNTKTIIHLLILIITTNLR